MSVLIFLIGFAQLLIQLSILLALASPNTEVTALGLSRVDQIRRDTIEALLAAAVDEQQNQRP
jgi:hypothetical protein